MSHRRVTQMRKKERRHESQKSIPKATENWKMPLEDVSFTEISVFVI